MAREIPCAICKIDDNTYTLVKLNNEQALAVLCKKHKKNKDNLERIAKRIPPHQLQNVLNQYMEDTSKASKDSTEARIKELKKEIASLNEKINKLEQEPKTIVKETVKEVQPKLEKLNCSVNEYGELI